MRSIAPVSAPFNGKISSAFTLPSNRYLPGSRTARARHEAMPAPLPDCLILRRSPARVHSGRPASVCDFQPSSLATPFASNFVGCFSAANSSARFCRRATIRSRKPATCCSQSFKSAGLRSPMAGRRRAAISFNLLVNICARPSFATMLEMRAR